MINQPKIIIVTPWFGDFSGGAENLAKSLACEFNKRGISTSIFTTCCKSPNNDWWTDYYQKGTTHFDDITIHRFPTNKKSKHKYQSAIQKLSSNNILDEKEKTSFFINGINSDELVFSLKPYLNKNYEIIALPFFQGLTHSVINKYQNKISLIPCFHDEPQFYWNNTETLLRNSKYVFFNSIEEKELTIKNYGLIIGKKIIEGIVTGVGVEINQKTNNQKPINLPTNYFVYVGKKDKGKNVDTLCKWFETYSQKYDKNSKIVFIGPGDKSLIPDNNPNFIDLGFVSESQKYTIIKNSKGLINLSHNESFSIVLIESWLLGIPTIVNKQCDVTTGHSIRANAGLYVENEIEFCLSLKYIIDNPNIAKIMGTNGQSYAKQQFNYDTVLGKYLSKINNYENPY